MPATEKPCSRDEGVGGIGLKQGEWASEQPSVQSHHQRFLDAVQKMTALAEGSIDREERDRFAMLSVIADKHWKVVAKYLPLPDQKDEAISEIRRIVVNPVMTHEQWLEQLK